VHGSRQDGLGQLESPAGWLHPHTGTHLHTPILDPCSSTRISTRENPPFPSCSSSTRSMTSSEFFSSSYVACQWGPELFADTSVSLLPRHPTTTTTPNLWIFCFRFQTKTKIIKLPKPERCTNCGMEFSKHYLRQNLLMEVRGVPA